MNALKLNEYLFEFRECKQKYDSLSYIEKMHLELAPNAIAPKIEFQDNNNFVLAEAPFYCADKINPKKRLLYYPAFAYINKGLYIVALGIDEQELTQDTKWWGFMYSDSWSWKTTEKTHWINYQTIWKIRNKDPKNHDTWLTEWLTERLEGLVKIPSKKLLEKWLQEFEYAYDKDELLKNWSWEAENAYDEDELLKKLEEEEEAENAYDKDKFN